MIGAVLLAAALSARAAPTEDAHRAPASSTADRTPSVEAERQNTLSEMWQRHLLPPEAGSFRPEDTALLARLRRAEAAGALDLLRRRLRGLKGLAAPYRPVGALATQWRLTKEGFERYLFLRSQDALEYFESKEIGAKLAFQLTDLDGHRLFEKNGRLTEAGEEVYNRVLANLEVHWRTPSGEVLGNRRRPPQAQPKSSDEP